MRDESLTILNIEPLGFPWATRDPFLFCVYHADHYPEGNGEFGPAAPLTGRNLGNDFTLKDGWRMYDTQGELQSAGTISDLAEPSGGKEVCGTILCHALEREYSGVPCEGCRGSYDRG